MKLRGRDAHRFCRSPDPKVCGVLLFGADAGQIAAERVALVKAVLGPDGDEMRLSRLQAADARKDTAAVDAELRAQGFFPGRRVVLIEGGTDGLGKPLASALTDITPDDALLVVTADALAARSALRKLFEEDKRLLALQFFADAPEPADIEEALRAAGLTAGITPDARDALVAIGSGMDHGSFHQLIELIALHGLDRNTPLELTDVEALAPAGLDGEIDQLVDAVAGGAADRIGAVLRRLSAGGAAPVTLLIALQRHFRMLLTAASAEGGPSAGLAAIRPPLWGPRRTSAQAQLGRWGQGRLEQASRLLFETDSKVRSSQQAPDMALVERCALRLALMAGR